MGLMAESMVAYEQPLLDETDGSQEQMQNALSIAQMCWNLALLSGTEQEEMLASMRPALKMDDAEFAGIRVEANGGLGIVFHSTILLDGNRVGYVETVFRAAAIRALTDNFTGLGETGRDPSRFGSRT